MGAYRLKCNNSWRNLEYGHSRITNVITNPVLEMGSDYMLPKYSFEKPFDIKMDWEYWCHKEEQCLSKGHSWYTDGLKTDNGSGAGIHGRTQRHDIYVYLGKCIHIPSDSQAALKALTCHQTRSQLVW
jgi:hypothetical protein